MMKVGWLAGCLDGGGFKGVFLIGSVLEIKWCKVNAKEWLVFELFRCTLYMIFFVSLGKIVLHYTCGNSLCMHVSSPTQSSSSPSYQLLLCVFTFSLSFLSIVRKHFSFPLLVVVIEGKGKREKAIFWNWSGMMWYVHGVPSSHQYTQCNVMWYMRSLCGTERRH